MPVTTKVQFKIDVIETEASAGVGGQTSHLRHLFEKLQTTFADGTADNESDVVWSSDNSVANGAPDTYDLRGGVTSNLTGDAIAFVEITHIAVLNLSTTAAEILTVGAGSNPVIGAQEPIGPGGYIIWGNPQVATAVTATTGDILTITSASGTISYRVIVVGRTA